MQAVKKLFLVNIMSRNCTCGIEVIKGQLRVEADNEAQARQQVADQIVAAGKSHIGWVGKIVELSR